jgi:poly(hydroxyalkanoate) depolymerase family esterase
MTTLRSILLAMTLISSTAPLAAQAEPEPAGAAGSWRWVALEGHPERRFRLFVPAALPAEGAAPLVVMLHGCTQDPDDLARGSRFNPAAAEHGVIVAYPEQPVGDNPQKCWNWFLPAHQARDQGEPALIAALTRQVMASERIDSSRVFVAGISAGGAMAQNVGAAYPDLFAAVGAHSAIGVGAATDTPSALAAMRGELRMIPGMVQSIARYMEYGQPAAFFAIHGEADAVVAPINLAESFVAWGGAHGAGTARDDSVQAGGRAAVRTRQLSSGGTFPVEVWRVAGLGHAWSGGSRAGTFADPAGPDASRLMLDFFLSHPRRRR